MCKNFKPLTLGFQLAYIGTFNLIGIFLEKMAEKSEGSTTNMTD